jgi:hypothetical protein
MENKNNRSDLEKRILDYTLKIIDACSSPKVIIAIDDKTISKHRDKIILCNDPFPTEFEKDEVEKIKSCIHGADTRIHTVSHWYKQKLMQLKCM